MTKLAETLRARAANGESFAVLQKEAYQSAGMKSNPPNASMGKNPSDGSAAGARRSIQPEGGRSIVAVNRFGWDITFTKWTLSAWRVWPTRKTSFITYCKASG